jgi:hypothetical protein
LVDQTDVLVAAAAAADLTTAKTDAAADLAAYVTAGGSENDAVYTAVTGATTVDGVTTARQALVDQTAVLVAAQA